jgi:tight adherence protein C
MTLSTLMMIGSIGAAIALAYLVLRGSIQRFAPRIQDEMAKHGGANRVDAARSAAVRVTAHAISGRLNDKMSSGLKQQIAQLGSPKGMTPEVIIAGRITTGAVFGLGFVLLAVIAGRFTLLPFFLLAGAGLGWLVAVLWFRRMLVGRQKQILRSLPYELDLLTLAVEAGLDFVGGLHKVVEKGRPGPLRDELNLVLRAIRLGRSRSEALSQMAERVDLPPVRAWVRALVQADRMGTPLGRILRMQADRLRERRAQAAEKAANEAPVKLLFPLIFFIFPTVFLVLFGPIVFRIFFVGL